MSNIEPGSQASLSRDCPPASPRPVAERIAAREAEIGDGFPIRRALPARRRRMVGAWCFLDHAGPVDHEAGRGLQIGPHPHIGLQTFTWMIEGEVLHLDSLGYEQLIRPGQVNLMTAGRGISHAEESPADRAGRFHAAQLWIALPEQERHRAPDFHHYAELPVLDDGGFRITLLAGSHGRERSPAQVYTPLVGLDLAAPQQARTTLDLQPAFEHAVLTLEGAPQVNGEELQPGSLLYLGAGRDGLEVQADRAARLLLVGGEPFGEEILLWWNFVARSPAEMAEAAQAWAGSDRFGQVRGARGRPLVAPDPKGIGSPGSR